MNSVVRQMWEQNTDVVMVDTGNSYEGLCEYVGGKYISYTDEHPITMNPFAIKREELNIEKIGFLKNLVMLIWKGTQGEVTKTEDRLIEQVITEYFDEYFMKKQIENLSFNTFYEYSKVRIPQIIKENNLVGIDLASYNYLLKDFYKGVVMSLHSMRTSIQSCLMRPSSFSRLTPSRVRPSRLHK